MAIATNTLVPQTTTNSANVSVGQYSSTTTAPLYIPAQVIGFTCHGLKPNTRLSVFFDGINVTQYCSPATYDSSLTNPSPSDYHIITAGGSIVTDANGTAIAVFTVPASQFQVGTREFHVFDYNVANDIYSERTQNYSCQAFAYYSAFNYSGTEPSVPSIISTIPAGSTSSVTLTTRGSGTSTSGSTNNPLSQTFYIGSDMTEGQDGLYIAAIDLYFQAKSSTQPITIDIRTVDNGIPTTTIIPYSQVTIQSASVIVSSNGQTPTSINFPTPIYLRAGYSYALTVTPGGGVPDYVIWTGVAGETDVVNGVVNSSWGQGSLFTASTGSTWTPIQTEFLKFTLYRTNFTNFSTAGSASFVNLDYEFLSYSNTSTIPFQVGEYVYQMPHPFGGFVSVNTTSNLISYNSYPSYINSYSFATDFSVNDFILIVGSVPASNTSNNVLNWGIFSNVVTVQITAVNAGNNTLQFQYANGAPSTGAPWANGVAAFFKPAKGTLSITAGSNAVMGTGTRFDQQYNNNYQDGSNKVPLVVQWSNGTFDGHEVLWPSNVANSTYMTLRNTPLTTNATAIPLTTPVGRVVSVDTNRQLIMLDTSSANGSSGNTAWQNVFSTPSYFSTSRVLVGTQSGATALISHVVDINASTLHPILYQTSIQGTTVTYSANTTAFNYTDVDYPSLSISSVNYLTNNQIIIASKTNEINFYSGAKSFTLNANLTTSSALSSPSIDASQLTMLAGTSVIGPDASNEYTNYGTALAKSVSLPVTLGDGNDSEDIQVYLTAYRPSGTDIQVFVKLLNSADTDQFSNKYWTPLQMVGNTSSYSDSSNLEDWIEYQYGLPTDPTVFKALDLVTTNNSTTITSTSGNTAWQSIFNNNQLLVVYSDSSSNPSSYEVHMISNVVSNTQITLSTPITMANTSSAIIGSMSYPFAAYKNSLNQNIVRYYTADGSAHDSYIQYAVKIVLLSANTALPPKVQNMRALALSV